MRRTFVVGDIHGQRSKLVELLKQSNLIDDSTAWAGGDATLWFMGDFVDRGPDGIGVIDLVMRLQQEAPLHGGQVRALLGNHDPLLIAARRFGGLPSGGPGGTFLTAWEANGGLAADLERLTDRHMAWITALPAMALVEGRLFIHADALFYLRYGYTIDAVNKAFRRLLKSDDDAAWDRMLSDFSERDAFLGNGNGNGNGGPAAAERLLAAYGGSQIVHGHTPIARTTGQAPQTVTAPLTYAGGRCINVDAGLYLGGPGFIHSLT